MEVLGLFLETTCFLEIAAPTTLHLVVPRHESILFVDHVRLDVLIVFVMCVLTETVVDISAAIQCIFCEAEMGGGIRGGYVSYIPLGRAR